MNAVYKILRNLYRYPTYSKLRVWLQENQHYFAGKKALEVGGPSGMFRKDQPLKIYQLASVVDGCNFAANTIWEGEIQEGRFLYEDGKPAGYQYICEADDLKPVADAAYDVLLSCHSLEHLANPIKALYEWKRVLKPGGVLLIIVPEMQFTFDHRRPYTSFEHLLDDYRNKVDETDTTHLEEILKLHDMQRDPGAGTAEQFKARSMDNFKYRCLHHHVFSLDLLRKVTEEAGFKVIDSLFFKPINNMILVQK